MKIVRWLYGFYFSPADTSKRIDFLVIFISKLFFRFCQKSTKRTNIENKNFFHLPCFLSFEMNEGKMLKRSLPFSYFPLVRGSSIRMNFNLIKYHVGPNKLSLNIVELNFRFLFSWRKKEDKREKKKRKKI